MKLRFVLGLLSLFLSLSISADRTVTNCPAAWSPASASSSFEQGLGVNIHFTEPQSGEVKMIADAGFRWIRMDFVWAATERARRQYDFSSYDRLIAALEPFHLKALFILDYGNPLYDSGGPPRSEEARQAFARWAATAAKHFADRNVIWEIYNEPNNKMFWPPRPNVDEYIALALAVGRAFRAAAPDAKLIGPATAGVDFDFLEACFKAGLLDYWSAVSTHPYRHSDPETVTTDYCRLRKLIDRYSARSGTRSGNDAARVSTQSGSDGAGSTNLSLSDSGSAIPIISGEWGYSAVWRNTNEQKQGEMLARQLLTNIANGVSVSIWYDWRDDGTDPKEAEHHFGLVRNAHLDGRDQVYQPKQAYFAAKTLNDFLDGYRFERRLAVGSDEDYVLVFANGNDRRMAAWTTGAAAHPIEIPFGPGPFLAIKHTGEATTPIHANQQSLAIEVSSAPVYVMRTVRPKP